MITVDHQQHHHLTIEFLLDMFPIVPIDHRHDYHDDYLHHHRINRQQLRLLQPQANAKSVAVANNLTVPMVMMMTVMELLHLVETVSVNVHSMTNVEQD